MWWQTLGGALQMKTANETAKKQPTVAVPFNVPIDRSARLK